jgi:hypothetical protein
MKCKPDVKLVRTVLVEVTVPFYSYDNTNKNAKAERDIVRWVKDTLVNEASYIPLYVEKDGPSYIEDCTRKTSVKIKDIR